CRQETAQIRPVQSKGRSRPYPQNRRPRIPSHNHNVKQRENPMTTGMYCHPSRLGERAYTPGETVLSNPFVYFSRPAEFRHFSAKFRLREHHRTQDFRPPMRSQVEARYGCMALTMSGPPGGKPLICYQDVDRLREFRDAAVLLG